MKPTTPVDRITIDLMRRGDGWVSVVTVYRPGSSTDDTSPMSDICDTPAKALSQAAKAVRRVKVAVAKSGGAR